jgi:hypothetical protein
LANTLQGYELYSFSDALQATQPVFIKVEYGSGAAATNPAVRFTVGTAHNGSGTLTGYKTTLRLVYSALNAVTVTVTSWVCGASDRLTFMLDLVGTGATASFNCGCIERTHDVLGNNTTDGVLISLTDSYQKTWVTFFSFTGGEVSTTQVIDALVPSVGYGSIGTQTMVFPVFPTRGVYLNPFMNVLWIFSNNVTEKNVISFTHLGATRSYFPLSPGANFYYSIKARVTEMAILLRYE